MIHFLKQRVLRTSMPPSSLSNLDRRRQCMTLVRVRHVDFRGELVGNHVNVGCRFESRIEYSECCIVVSLLAPVLEVG